MSNILTITEYYIVYQYSMNSTYILVPELWIQIVLIKVLMYLKTKNEKKKFKPEKMQNLKKTVTKLLMSYIISELY